MNRKIIQNSNHRFNSTESKLDIETVTLIRWNRFLMYIYQNRFTEREVNYAICRWAWSYQILVKTSHVQMLSNSDETSHF